MEVLPPGSCSHNALLIDGANQNALANQDDPIPRRRQRLAFAQVDLTEAYKPAAAKAARGLALDEAAAQSWCRMNWTCPRPPRCSGASLPTPR